MCWRGPKDAAYTSCLHFSICACHPCAGAMLIFSVSFQCQRMIPEGNPKDAAYACFETESRKRSFARALPVASSNCKALSVLFVVAPQPSFRTMSAQLDATIDPRISRSASERPPKPEPGNASASHGGE